MRIFDADRDLIIQILDTDLDPKNVARYLLGRTMMDDGHTKLNHGERVKYLMDSREGYEEVEDRKLDLSMVADMIADRIVYGARYHILDGRTEVGNEFRASVAVAITDKLLDSLKKKGSLTDEP